MLFTFWKNHLTWFERVCFAAAAAAGHRLTVYSYEPLVGLPPGVAVGDANQIIHSDRVFQHQRSGSVAMFSDLFRYEGLRRGLGTWIDADMLVLRPLPSSRIILARDHNNEVGNSVLRLPAEHSFLAEMKRLSEARVPIASHWPLRHKLRQIARTCVGRPMPLSEMKLATFGPPALTQHVKVNKLDAIVLAPTVFYPLPGANAEDAFTPSADVERLFTPDTVGVHLWHSKIISRKGSPPPSGSFLARMCEKYDIDTKIPLKDQAV